MLVPAGGTKLMTVKYSALGKDEWRYLLGEGGKARNFTLTMDTNFTDFNVPADVESPTSRPPRGCGHDPRLDLSQRDRRRSGGLAVPDFIDAAKVHRA